MTMNTSHPNVSILRAIYQDLRRIADFSDETVVLHPAERSHHKGALPVVGKQAVLAKELDLIRLTGESLLMEVSEIVANESFGVALSSDRPIFAEHAVYANANGIVFAAGGAATASELP